jgi:hypothetical protein
LRVLILALFAADRYCAQFGAHQQLGVCRLTDTTGTICHVFCSPFHSARESFRAK